MTILAKAVTLLLLISAMSGCYRMPEDDEYSMVPSTNNSTYTREKGGQAPGVSY